jgi:dolichol-phosphate mannosyltransferase
VKHAVVIPTYNEAAALPTLLDSLVRLEPGFRILIVDDHSPDGTGRLADELASSNPRIRVLHRPGKLGLGSAYRDGFRACLAEGAEYLFEMDADHSHNPKYIRSLLRCLEDGADVAIGSRYVHGVRVENWPFRRLLLSRFANAYVNLATGMPASTVSDATSGFRGYRRVVLQALDLDTVRSNGYSFQIEMAYRAWRMGFRVRDVPITFEEHYLSSSKISRAIIWEAIWRTPLLRLTAARRRPDAEGQVAAGADGVDPR